MGAGLSALCFIAHCDLLQRHMLEEFPSVSLLSDHCCWLKNSGEPELLLLT